MTWMFRWSAAGSLTAHRRPPYLLRRWRVNIDACPALHSCYLFRFITFLVFFCTYVNKTFVARYQHSLVFISVGNSTWANRSWSLFKMSNFERKSEERKAKEWIPNPGIHTFHSRIVYMSMFVTLLQRFLVWNFNRTDKIFICSLIVFLCIFVSIYSLLPLFFYKKLSSFNASMVWKAVCSALRQEVNHRGNTKAVG